MFKIGDMVMATHGNWFFNQGAIGTIVGLSRVYTQDVYNEDDGSYDTERVEDFTDVLVRWQGDYTKSPYMNSSEGDYDEGIEDYLPPHHYFIPKSYLTSLENATDVLGYIRNKISNRHVQYKERMSV